MTARGGYTMQPGNEVVAIVDSFDACDVLLNQACSCARQRSVEVHFVYVFDFFKDDPMLDNIYVERCEKKLEDQARVDMNLLLERARRLHPHCTGEVVSGQKSEICKELIDNVGEDLLFGIDGNLERKAVPTDPVTMARVSRA